VIALKTKVHYSRNFKNDKVKVNVIHIIDTHWHLLFQHLVFGICRLIDILVPDVPGSLEVKIKRERYLAKQALADTDTIMKVDHTPVAD